MPHDDELAAMLATAGDLGMGALVETHADDELERAVASGAAVIGVNARDLETLDVDVPVRARAVSGGSPTIGSPCSSRGVRDRGGRRRGASRRARLPSWLVRP